VTGTGSRTGDLLRELAPQVLGVPEATMAQRISRAKQGIKASGLDLTVPEDPERTQRLHSVLHVLYLIFNEGYTAASGDQLAVPALSQEAIRLTRWLHRLLPADSEVTGLLALMLLTDARRPARTLPDGSLVPLAEQDRGKWDRQLIAEGVALITAALPVGQPGPRRLLPGLHPPVLTGSLFLTLPHPVGIELHFEAGRFLLQLRRGHLRRGGGQDLVGLRGLLIGQKPSELGDDLRLVSVDGSGGHPGERGRQARGQGIGQVHPLPGGVMGAVQIHAEFLGGELSVPVARLIAARLGCLICLLAAAGEFGDRGQFLVLIPGLPSTRRQHHPHQLIIVQRPDICDDLAGQRRFLLRRGLLPARLDLRGEPVKVPLAGIASTVPRRDAGHRLIKT
jgi:uncharacterized protein DUF6596